MELCEMQLSYFSSKLQEPNQSRLSRVQVLLQVERPALDLPSKVLLHWSNWSGAPDAQQLLRIKKWAVEIKESFFPSQLWCRDGPCAEFPAAITAASEAAAPAKGCARFGESQSTHADSRGCCWNCVWSFCAVGTFFFILKCCVLLFLRWKD